MYTPTVGLSRFALGTESYASSVMKLNINKFPYLRVSRVTNEVFVDVGYLVHWVSEGGASLETINTSTLFPVTGSVTDLAPLTVEVAA